MAEGLKPLGGRLAFLFSFVLIGLSSRTAPMKESTLQVGSGTCVQGAAEAKHREQTISHALSQTTASTDAALSNSGANLLVLHWKGQDCYVPQQFYLTVAQTRSQIINSLDKPELLALRSYADAYFEALKGVMPPVIQIGQPLGQSVPGLPKQQADAVLQRIHDLLEKLNQLNPLAIDLDIRSQPKGADFAIQVGQNLSTNRTLNTNDQMPGVWRGLYTATIKMAGYKTGTFKLDLVDDSRGKLACTLIPSDQAGETSCGRLVQ